MKFIVDTKDLPLSALSSMVQVIESRGCVVNDYTEVKVTVETPPDPPIGAIRNPPRKVGKKNGQFQAATLVVVQFPKTWRKLVGHNRQCRMNFLEAVYSLGQMHEDNTVLYDDIMKLSKRHHSSTHWASDLKKGRIKWIRKQ